MTRDELVEKVLAAMYSDVTDARTSAIRGIRVALEEAAKVADRHAESTEWIDGHHEAKDIAAAIRALGVDT